jgi:hypothetical protein
MPGRLLGRRGGRFDVRAATLHSAILGTSCRLQNQADQTLVALAYVGKERDSIAPSSPGRGAKSIAGYGYRGGESTGGSEVAQGRLDRPYSSTAILR